MDLHGQEDASDNLLRRDDLRGWIVSENSRVIAFDMNAFVEMVDKVMTMTGPIVGSVLFYSSGHALGLHASRLVKNHLTLDKDGAKVLDSLCKRYGMGRCLGLKPKERSDVIYVATMEGTILSRLRRMNEPICHLERGMVAGFIEGYFGRKAISSVERECVSMGHEFCVFEVALGDSTRSESQRT